MPSGILGTSWKQNTDTGLWGREDGRKRDFNLETMPPPMWQNI